MFSQTFTNSADHRSRFHILRLTGDKVNENPITNGLFLKTYPNLPYLMYRVILSVLDPRKCEYLKDYSLDFEHAYMTTYLAS